MGGLPCRRSISVDAGGAELGEPENRQPQGLPDSLVGGAIHWTVASDVERVGGLLLSHDVAL